MSAVSAGQLVSNIEKQYIKKNVPRIRTGDTVRVHAKIKEGNKERIQVFEGVVIKRHNGNLPTATFTVRKVSYNVGVERTFFLHSPRIEKIEVTARGIVRRSRLYYLRPLRGKATRIKSQFVSGDQLNGQNAESLEENVAATPVVETAVEQSGEAADETSA